MPYNAIDSHGQTTQIFWGEISPCEHLVQIYEDEAAFMDCLEGFAGGGIRAGDGVVIIATHEHLHGLESRLRASGLDLSLPALRDQYLAYDAEQMLSKFMVRDWPDDFLFEQVVTDVLRRATRDRRRVRAFGEMVALLWKQGHTGATVRLEHLWHRICQEKALSLFCAYPRIGFTQDADASIKEICAAHSKVICG